MNKALRAIWKLLTDHMAEDLEITTGVLRLYVDYATGDDQNGKGTVPLPYKTPLRAYADIPRRVAHACSIQIAAGNYPAGSFPRAIDNVLVGGGSLTFYGKGAPARKAGTGGPHTVASIAATDITQIVTVAGAAWTVDEFCGCWLRVITGGHPKQTFPIYGNTAGTISIPLDAYSEAVHAADSIEIIYPSVKVAIEDLDIFYATRAVMLNASYKGAHLVFANLWLNASASASTYGQLRIHSESTAMDGPDFEFVRFDGLSYGIVVDNVNINRASPIDNGYVAGSSADIANMGRASSGAGLSLVSAIGRADPLVYACGESKLDMVTMTGQLNMARGAWLYFSGGASQIIADTCPLGGELYAWLAGVAASAGLSVSGGLWYALFDVAGDCTYAIETKDGAIVRLHGECKCSATLCTLSALRIGAMCKVTTDHALAGFLGATALQCAYICQMGVAVKAATWPAAGTYVTDAKGGEFLRVA